MYDHKCGMCGSSRNLTAHHIVERHDPFNPLGVEKDNRSNLYPLCRQDHDALERKIEDLDKRNQRVIYKRKRR